MTDPASWPVEAQASIARMIATGDVAAVARQVLHEASKLGAATDVLLDQRGQSALGEVADALAEEAAAFVFNVGAPTSDDNEALREAQRIIRDRIRAAVTDAQSGLLDRLQVRLDGVSTIGPPPAPPDPAEVRRERAGRVVSRILDRECANLAPAEKKLVTRVMNSLADGEAIDPATSAALEDLFKKSHPLAPVVASKESITAEYERNGDEISAYVATWRDEWTTLDAEDQEWLRQRVGLRLSPEDQPTAWRMKADCAYRRFSKANLMEAVTALVRWKITRWDNADVLTEGEAAWLDSQARSEPIVLSVDDALYVLELRAVQAEEA